MTGIQRKRLKYLRIDVTMGERQRMNRVVVHQDQFHFGRFTMITMQENVVVNLVPVEFHDTQSIFSFIHEDREFYLVGDEEVVGVEKQDVKWSDIAWFVGLNLNEITDSLESAHEIAIRRDGDREDW